MKSLWKEAQKHLAGGVSSPVRAFKAVGGAPVFVKSGQGPYLFDSNGKKYVDHCLSWGALILGHADKKTIEAIVRQARKGTTFGAATELETRLALEIKKAFPSMKKIRFTSSGTEAAMSALRLARGVTGKDRIVKFEGCYHGHSDGLLVKAGSGLAAFGNPSSGGVPKGIARLTAVLPYNDIQACETFFKREKNIACVIVEPVAANMGVVPADKKFLEVLRRLTKRSGALLIFDEVISGYRVAYGGVQTLLGVTPDITILGKIIGGGLPVGAFGASDEIMARLSPTGNIYQAGTLSGNPLSMVAGLAVLSRLSKSFYSDMGQKTGRFLSEARKILSRKKAPVSIASMGSMFTVFFNFRPPRNFKEVSRSDPKGYANFFRQLLRSGVYFPPSGFEACFLSQAHGQKELDKTLDALYHIDS